MRFTDITTAYKIDGEGFAWGAVFEDLNLDGRLDLLVAQNYIKWPVHKLFKLPGRTYLQTVSNANNFFKHTKSLGLENRFYGQSPLIADLDNDGRPDVLWLNMDGSLRAFINKSPANYLTIAIPDTPTLLGARVSIETSVGKSYTKEVVTSTGMLTDQTTDLVFGLGDIETVKRVTITRPNGATETIDSPRINTTITIN